MKATGIVRRLDDLGRLVIPKEIRKIYKLKEGDSIEFFVNENDEIVLKKFSVLSDEIEMITQMCQTLQESIGHPVLFVEDDQILCVGHSKLEEMKQQTLSAEFQEFVKSYHVRPFEQIRMFSAVPDTMKGTIFPITGVRRLDRRVCHSGTGSSAAAASSRCRAGLFPAADPFARTLILMSRRFSIKERRRFFVRALQGGKQCGVT